jgi:hypothetical protein
MEEPICSPQLDTAIRDGLAKLSCAFLPMKKTKAELAWLVQKSIPGRLPATAVRRPALLPSNKTAVHA